MECLQDHAMMDNYGKSSQNAQGPLVSAKWFKEAFKTPGFVFLQLHFKKHSSSASNGKSSVL